FIEQLAAPTATPGGGSASAASGAMAASLACMVAQMSRGKKAYVEYESQLGEAIIRLTQLRAELKSAIDADAESYNVVMRAYKAAKESAKESNDGARAINAALRQATNVPLSVAEYAVEVEQIALRLKPMTNPHMGSDLTTAIALAKAAVTGALANVDINLGSFKPDSPEVDAFVSQTRRRATWLKTLD